MLPCVISQDIVKYLHEVKGFSLEEIASITSLSEKDIQNIHNGFQTFTAENIKSIVESQNETIIKLLAEACLDEHLPQKLKEHVSFYKHIQKVKQKTKNKR